MMVVVVGRCDFGYQTATRTNTWMIAVAESAAPKRAEAALAVMAAAAKPRCHLRGSLTLTVKLPCDVSCSIPLKLGRTVVIAVSFRS